MNLTIKNLENNNLLSNSYGSYTNQQIIFAKATALHMQNDYENFAALYEDLFDECNAAQAIELNEKYKDDEEAEEEFFNETKLAAERYEWSEEEEQEEEEQEEEEQEEARCDECGCPDSVCPIDICRLRTVHAD